MGSDTGQMVLKLRSTLHMIRYKTGTGWMVDNLMPVRDEDYMQDLPTLAEKRDVLLFVTVRMAFGKIALVVQVTRLSAKRENLLRTRYLLSTFLIYR